MPTAFQRDTAVTPDPAKPGAYRGHLPKTWSAPNVPWGGISLATAVRAMQDAAPVRRFAEAGVPLFVSNSFSKSFSLYGERVGALSVVASSSDEAARVLSQLKRLVRTNYSNPPTHGGKIVNTKLGDLSAKG